MTAKEKAEELCKKTAKALGLHYHDNTRVIEATLVSVNEILSELYNAEYIRIVRYNFWLDVRKELKNL